MLAEARNVRFSSRAQISILVHDVESLVNRHVPTPVEGHHVDHHTSGTVAREKCIRAGEPGGCWQLLPSCLLSVIKLLSPDIKIERLFVRLFINSPNAPMRRYTPHSLQRVVRCP
jgi:hypothetical protein